MRAIRGTHQSSGLSEMSSQFHEECSAAPGRFCIDKVPDSGFEQKELRLRSRDVYYRVKTYGLGDHATPSRIEGAHDVAVGLSWRRRCEQEGVLETQAGKRRGEFWTHGSALEERLTIAPG